MKENTDFKRHLKDTGSSEVQIVNFTTKINKITKHLISNKKDKHSKYGLIKIIFKRRKLLNYLKKHKKQIYLKLLKSLNIRK